LDSSRHCLKYNAYVYKNSLSLKTLIKKSGVLQVVPEDVEVRAVDSVTWYKPDQFPESDTITLVFGNKFMIGLIAPFAVANSSEFSQIPINSNNEPILMPC
jgi:hypothetical protein